MLRPLLKIRALNLLPATELQVSASNTPISIKLPEWHLDLTRTKANQNKPVCSISVFLDSLVRDVKSEDTLTSFSKFLTKMTYLNGIKRTKYCISARPTAYVLLCEPRFRTNRLNSFESSNQNKSEGRSRLSQICLSFLERSRAFHICVEPGYVVIVGVMIALNRILWHLEPCDSWTKNNTKGEKIRLEF